MPDESPTAITLPLDVVATLLKGAKKLGTQYYAPKEKADLVLAEREVEQVRQMVREGKAG